MCNLSDFFQTHPKTRTIQTFNEEECSSLLTYDISPDLLTFLQTERYSTYQNDFFYTTLPHEYRQILSEWGLDGEHCHVFLRTALGTLCFSKENKIFQLDPISGNLYQGIFPFCEFMNILVTTDSFMESCYFDIYQKIPNKQILKIDEIYALVPALPLGGSFETSHFEVVKMIEHLGFLAQLFNHRARNL